MIARIARKEMTEMLRDGRFRWTACIVAVLLTGALATGVSHYRRVAAERDAARQTARAHWVGQAPKNAHSAAHYGVYAFKPALPLSYVDRGVDPYVGVFAWLEAHKQNDFKYRPAQDATPIERFGAWTAASVLQLLVPLVIIMIAFPSFAGEREQGTLRQLLSLGVEPRQLTLGKAAGVAGALGVLLVPVSVVGALTLVATAGGDARGGAAGRVIALALAYVAYFGVFLAVALAISARARSPRSALIGLLAFWSVNALVAPRVATDLARRLHPTPSSLAFNAALERELVGDGSANRALEDSVKREYGVTSLDSLPVNFAAIRLQAGEEHGYQVFDAHYGDLARSFRAQERVQSVLGAVAPLIAIRALSMGLAGTDFEQHNDFAGAAERYRRSLVQLMNGSLLDVKPGAESLADSTLWAKLPPFEYEPPSIGWVLANHATSLLVLGAWVFAAVIFATRSTGRVTPDGAERGA